MPNTALVIDVLKLFQKTFGKTPYVVAGVSDSADSTGFSNDYRLKRSKAEQDFTAKGSLIKEQYRGVEIMLPVRFYVGTTSTLYLPYCVLSISGKKTIIETPMVERKGTVKEVYNCDDYTINIKGFLINEQRTFPEKEIDDLRKLCEARSSVVIENALTNIFLRFPNLETAEQGRVVIYDFSLPEVEGGRHVRPFTMMLKSDNIFKLEIE